MSNNILNINLSYDPFTDDLSNELPIVLSNALPNIAPKKETNILTIKFNHLKQISKICECDTPKDSISDDKLVLPECNKPQFIKLPDIYSPTKFTK